MVISHLRVIPFATLIMAALPGIAVAQDIQWVRVGNGAPGACVTPGTNASLDSTPAGDDYTAYVGGLIFNIVNGENGICESSLSGDDARPSDGTTLGTGRPYGRIVSGGSDGICDTVGTATADDVIELQPGTGQPRQIAIRRGANLTLDTTPSGDDVVATVICTGGDATLNSTPSGDDLVVIDNDVCSNACQDLGTVCIIPGVDDVLDSTINGADDPRSYISTGADGVLETAAAGDDTQFFPVGDGWYDPTCVNAGPDGIAQTALCGSGTLDYGEDCDDASGNSDTTPDACRSTCVLPSCGDGVVDPGNGETCEDNDNKNNDDCVLGCVVAACGDGFKHTSGTPPFEQCDDGNLSAGDGCDGSCQQEDPVDCGNGVVDPPSCSAGTTGPCGTDTDCDTTIGAGDGVCTTETCDDGNQSEKDDCRNNCRLAACGDGAVKSNGTPPYEECDDGNLSPGDGCGAVCENECGNGIVDGACAQGLIGNACSLDSGCDTSLGAGDGTCATEPCDIAVDGLCLPGPTPCSAGCTIASCGNEEVECGEQCDLGTSNGALGSGCSALCERTLVGAQELRSGSECPGAWTMDSPPQDLKYRKQICADGAACDFDAAVNGECIFSVGMCINRPEPTGCVLGPVVAVDMPRIDTSVPWVAAAAEELTGALSGLTSDASDVPGRCRDGRTRKNCALNVHCDSYLGAADGICDVGTGVSYTPPLDAFGDTPNQLAECTSGQPVTVPVGERLSLRSYVRRDAPLRGDRDNVRLFCVAP